MGPLLAALILLPVIGGSPAVKDLFRRFALWRVGWVWYLVVLPGPVVVTPVAVRINLMLGAQPLGAFQMPDPAGPGTLRIHLSLDRPRRGAGVAWLRPAAARGAHALSAALILGAIHAMWHLPLVGVDYFAWKLAPWTISAFCFSIVVAWNFRHTGGSVLMPIHASNNTVAVVWRMFEAADQARLWWVWAGLSVIATPAVVLAYGNTGRGSSHMTQADCRRHRVARRLLDLRGHKS